MRGEVDRDVPLLLGPRLDAVLIHDPHVVEERGPADRPCLDLATRHVADHQGRFGLAVAVPQRDARGFPPGVDDLRVQGFAGAHALPEAEAILREVLEDEHPPDGRGSTERGHFVVLEGLQLVPRVEPTGVVEREGGCPYVPRREERTPRELGPPGLADVRVDVLGLHPDPG